MTDILENSIFQPAGHFVLSKQMRWVWLDKPTLRTRIAARVLLGWRWEDHSRQSQFGGPVVATPPERNLPPARWVGPFPSWRDFDWRG